MIKYDIHTHAFHPKIAQKATAQLFDYYHIQPAGDGTLEGLLQCLRNAGIDRAVVHSAATTPEQVIPANNWAIRLQQEVPQVEAFGTIHVGFADWENELNRLRAAGIRGLKLHPDFQKIWLDDKKLLQMFEVAQDYFTVMFHIGDERPPEKNYSSPQKLAEIKRQFPRMRVIAAHLGGFHHWQYVVDSLADTDVFIDTSSALSFVSDELLREIRRHIPLDRWLFGSDFPLSTPEIELGLVKKRLKLSSRELDGLLTNAGRFFA